MGRLLTHSFYRLLLSNACFPVRTLKSFGSVQSLDLVNQEFMNKPQFGYAPQVKQTCFKLHNLMISTWQVAHPQLLVALLSNAQSLTVRTLKSFGSVQSQKAGGCVLLCRLGLRVVKCIQLKTQTLRESLYPK